MSSRRGVAIPFVLLVTLALYALAWGVFVTASSSLRSARVAVTLSELVTAAQTQLSAQVNLGPDTLANVLPIGATATRVDSLDVRVTEASWTRLSTEAWLVRVTVEPGSADLPGPGVSASRLVWHLDPELRIEAMADVMVGPGATVSFAGAPASPPSIAVEDSVMVGLLSLDDFMEGVEPVSGVVSPRVVTVSGRCDTTVAQNLGDPLGTSPCRMFVAQRRVEGDLEVRAGTGHVLLAGRGDIILTGGAYLRGLLLIDGSVWVRDGTFEGLIVAMGGVEVGSNAAFIQERVFARSALEAFVAQRPASRPLHPARNLFGN